MPNTDRDLIAELAEGLTRQSYSPVVVRNYCTYARDFLAYLAQHEIPVTAVKASQVAQYLRHAAVTFRKRRGRSPGSHESPNCEDNAGVIEWPTICCHDSSVQSASGH